MTALPPDRPATAEGIKYMDLDEFRMLGYLQEINRRVLHPCGLALEVSGAGPDVLLCRVWDYRTDPEGVYFEPSALDPVKAACVDAELELHREARRQLFGTVRTSVQPLGPFEPGQS